MAQKIVLIVGPTAVGKTALSVQLAQKFNGQIISGDSMQVYQGLDIGTAKVTPEEMDGVKHYLIDENRIDERFSAADFTQKCRQDVKLIAQAGCLPIIAGGTGFYLQALLDNFQLGADQYDENEVIRKKWEAYLAEHGSQALLEQLTNIDPKAAAKIPVNNPRRMIRALEVYEQTGQLFSEQNDLKSDEFESLVIGLTTNRKLLYERINLRVDLMMEQGLLAEAKMLYEKGGADLPAGKGIGYKEFYPYFAGEITLEEAVELVKRNSRRYAKRQLTWFRNKMEVQWFDLVQDPSQVHEIETMIEKWLKEV